MCSAPKITPPPPPPSAPMVLEQAAPESAAGKTSETKRKRQGLARYKIDTTPTASGPATKLGGIPTKTGV